MAEDIRKKLEQLKQQIRHHDYRYYVLNKPEISDRQYDRLFDELKSLENEHPELITPDSPTQRVAGEPVEGFASVRHGLAMMSIDNTYNPAELRAFDQRVGKGLGGEDYDYVVELKIDGLAINLRYEQGVLATAATRGDGRVGDDVTANARTIKSVPLRLIDDGNVPDVIEVRGEIYMPNRAFLQLNAQRQKEGKPPFANPRNAAAGSLKLLDPSITAKRNLSFFAYALGEISQPIADNHARMLERFESFGLPINPHVERAGTIDKALELCKQWEKRRLELDYKIDGMVVKVNRFAQQRRLGSTGRAPRWCISYKFEAEQAETVVESIVVQVGKSGILTPVANLRPVQLAGTTVKRASLHNFDQVARLGIRQGDTVIAEKAGEIIPQVVKVKKDLRPKDSQPVAVPSQCPNCQGPVEKDPDGVYIRCKNPNCLGQLREKLIHFVGRGQMDIEHLGQSLIDQLIENSKVTDFSDIYKLDVFELASLTRMGAKSAQRVIDSIEQSKTRPLWRFISALGISYVGNQTAQILAARFGSLEKLMDADLQQLEEIEQIGPKIAQSVYHYFNDQKNRELIHKLLEAGVKPEHAKGVPEKGPLAGKAVVLTGSLANFTRSQAKEAITAAGGKVTSSISKNTDFVLAGQSPGSKLDKARQLGVEVVSEQEFLKMLGR